MKKIIETGHVDSVEEERVQFFVSTGQGNTPHPEVHVTMLDPFTGEEIQAWFFRDDLLAAVLDPDPEVVVTDVLGATLQEPTA